MLLGLYSYRSARSAAQVEGGHRTHLFDPLRSVMSERCRELHYDRSSWPLRSVQAYRLDVGMLSVKRVHHLEQHFPEYLANC
jgi:hypothetical protein